MKGCNSIALNTRPEGRAELTDFQPDADYPPGFIKADSTSAGQHMPTPIPPVLPDVEDCSSSIIPDKPELMVGKKKIQVPVLNTMTKYFFDNYRLPMYSYVNRLRRNGTLSNLVGARVLSGIINHEVLSFPSVSFWRISRTEFYADVRVQLILDTAKGTVTWSGWLIVWCSFDDNFECCIEELTDNLDRKADGYVQLDSYLIPYSDNKRTDKTSEGIWGEYIPEALHDPKKRDPVALAKAMGLSIKPCHIYEHGGVSTILFFEDDDLVVGDDRVEKDEDGRKEHIKVRAANPEHILANTIVVNENLTKWQYSAFGIFHECYHYEEHYLFYRLQKMGSNDPRKVAVREIIVDANNDPNDYHDAIYFMEKQANRGAYGLMLPTTSTRELIERRSSDVGPCRHAGARYEAVGKKMGMELMLPHFRIRARMIQLGYIQAKGALNYVERELIEPFAFDTDAWREEQHTFVIDRGTMSLLCKNNDQFRAVMESGKYVYADGHVVRNDARFVREDDEGAAAEDYWADRGFSGGFDDCVGSGGRDKKLLLTDWANAHVDDCCLRFVRVYVQQNVGRYVFGRMYYDADYIKQTQFYLNDLINSEQIDELEAKTMYIQSFPKTFKGAIELLKKQNKVNNPMLAEYLNMDDSTFARSLSDPRCYMNADYLTLLCLYFKLPDWLSRLVFKRANVQLDEDVRRNQALLHILRVQSNDGVDAANEFLARSNLVQLKI